MAAVVVGAGAVVVVVGTVVVVGGGAVVVVVAGVVVVVAGAVAVVVVVSAANSAVGISSAIPNTTSATAARDAGLHALTPLEYQSVRKKVQPVAARRFLCVRISLMIRSSLGSVEESTWLIPAAIAGCTAAIRSCIAWATAR